MNRTIHRLAAMLAAIMLIISVIEPPLARADSLAGMDLREAPLVISNDTRSGMVRVNLSSLGSPSQMTVTPVGSYSVNGSASSALQSGVSVVVRLNSGTGRLTLTRGGVTYDMGTQFSLTRHESGGGDGVRIAAARTDNLYPGDLAFYARSGSSGYSLQVIAHIFIEDYLYGVLPYEMGNGAHIEALKAQAITARTYTMRAMESRSGAQYDVTDTTSDQVYNGTPSGYQNCKNAVDATRGIASKNGSSFTATFYTASNGGQIESVANIWGSTAYGYISVRDDPFDYACPASRVKKYTLSKSGTPSGALGTLLTQKADAALGAQTTVTAIKAITPHTPKYAAPSRLYTKADFELTVSVGGAARSVTVTCGIFSELESMLGMSHSSSNNELWTVSDKDDSYVLEARRWGHGTGMSQNGAMYMGQLGYSYAQIMYFYFPGCSRVQYTLTRTVLGAIGSTQQEIPIETPVDPADPGAQAACTAVVTLTATSSLPLRDKASQSAQVMTTIPNGTPLVVLASADEHCLVEYGAMRGYALKSGLRITGDIPSSSAQQATALYGFGTVKGSSGPLRASASSSAEIVTSVPGGTQIPILSVSDGWAYAQYGLKAGYIEKSALTIGGAFEGDTLDPDACGALVSHAEGAPLYATENTSGYIISTLPSQTELAVLAYGTSWSLVKHDGVTGYVQTSRIRLTGQPTPQSALDGDTLKAGETTALAAPTNGTLNMRAAPSLSGALILELTKGARVVVTRQDAEWSAIRYHGISGYAMTQYLNLTGALSPTPGQRIDTARVITPSGSLNLRKSASDQADVLRTIPQNTLLDVYERGGTWSRVAYQGQYGYVMSRFLQFASDAAPSPSPSASAAPSASPSPTVSVLPSATPIVTPTSPASALYARVTTARGSLNLRAQARGGATVLATIPQYAVIPILERGSTWCRTEYAETAGYVMTKFLTFLSDTAPTAAPVITVTATPAPGSVWARVVTVSGSLNLREYASKAADVITTIPQNALVLVTNRGMEWCRVDYQGSSGYVMTRFLGFDSYTPTATPGQTPAASASPTASPSQSPSPTSAAPVWAQVLTPSGSLNLRKTTSTITDVLITIPQYAYVRMLERADEWSKVEYNLLVGYVQTQFLSADLSATPAPTIPVTSTPTSVPTASPAPALGALYARVVTQSGSLNLREAKERYANVIATIPSGTLLRVLERGATWCAVEYGALRGYVMTAYLSFDGGTPTAQPVIIPTSTPPSGGTKAWVYTASGSLNLRDRPDGRRIASVPRLAEIRVYSAGNPWSYIAYGGVTGYAMSRYIVYENPSALNTPSPAPAQSPTAPAAPTQTTPVSYPPDPTLKAVENLTAVVNSDSSTLNLRDGCSTGATLLLEMPKGEIVQVLMIGDTWCQVVFGETTGYCMTKYLSFTAISAS